MNNLAISLKKFFTNKNTVTIIGVVAILVILYFLYTSTVNNATNLVDVPVAAKTINPQTLITSEDVTVVRVANAAKPTGVIENRNDIVGKYTGVGSTVPEGSMFYAGVVVNKEDLPGDWITLVGEDALGNRNIPYYFAVNTTTTFGNSIQPGDYVDFYVRAYNEQNMLMFGKMLSNLEVLAVTDSEGKDVFRSSQDVGTPAFLNFGLQKEIHDVLKKAEYLNGTQIDLIVVPHGGTPEENLEVNVSSEYLRDYIQNLSAKLPENPVVEPETPEEGTDSNSNTTSNANNASNVTPAN